MYISYRIMYNRGRMKHTHAPNRGSVILPSANSAKIWHRPLEDQTAQIPGCQKRGEIVISGQHQATSFKAISLHSEHGNG